MTVPTDLSRAETLRTLREQVNTHVALPGEPGYERCMPWNVAAAIMPAAGGGQQQRTALCHALPVNFCRVAASPGWRASGGARRSRA